jgi:hypothetical protein
MDKNEQKEAKGYNYAQKRPFFHPTLQIQEILNEILQTV